VRAGFGSASLWGTWQTSAALADDIDVRVVVLRDDDCTAAIAVADLCFIWPTLSLRIRDGVASVIGAPAENVGVFCTQNHGTPGAPSEADAFDTAAMESAFARAASEAIASLKPVEYAHVNVRPQPPLTFRRRVHLDGLGEFTFWYGLGVSEGEPPDASLLVEAALAGLASGAPGLGHSLQLDGRGIPESGMPASPIPVPHPCPLPPASDGLVQGLFFRDMEGSPVGSILRFASHPATANRLGAARHSGDYPAYARRRLERTFGGRSVFLAGPCGDQICAVGRKSLELAERVGGEVADFALRELGAAVWRADGPLRAASPEVTLEVRRDFPASREDASQEMAAIEARFQEAAPDAAHLPELKRLADRYEFLTYVANPSAFTGWTGLELAGRAGHGIAHPLFLLRIGETIIAGLPGEPFGRYSARLRDETIGDALVVVEEANGYLGYVPSPSDYPLGGYEVSAAALGPGSEDAMVSAVKAGLPALLS